MFTKGKKGDMMKKMIIALFAFVLILTGCSSQATSEVVELDFATWAGGTELEELQAIVDEVNAEHADEYVITIQSVPADYPMKMQTQLSAGQGTDLMWIDQTQLAPMAAQGVLLPLDDYISGSEELSEYSFNEALKATASYNDQQYGVPWIANPMVMYYNEDLVSPEDKAILDQAVTGTKLSMQEFQKMAAKYQTADTNGVLFNGWPPYEYFLWNFGGEIEDVEGNVLFNSPEGLAATEYVVDTIITNPITPDMEVINAVGYTETFQQGNTAFLMGGTADGIELVGGEPVDFNVGYTVVPGDFTYNWSASYAITKDAENPDVAFDALVDLTLKTWDWKMVPPVEITELGFKDYEEYLAQNAPQKAGMGEVIAASMDMTHDYTYSPNSAKIYSVIWEEIFGPILNARITNTTVDAQTLIDNAQKVIESE